jgi:HAD superfamily hydrolase (TIGR01459 family)
MTTHSITRLTGPLELGARFDGFLVDLWGVVHDGEQLFPGVVDALGALADRGAKLCFLSNSSRLGALLAENLVALGIPRTLFSEVVSSGDVTRRALIERDPAVFRGLPEDARVLHIGNPAYVPWLFELGFAFVDSFDLADLVVATGTVADEGSLLELRDRLAPLAARGTPLVCTNPDRVVLSKTGLHLAPGAVAQVYETIGGPTFLYGKPHPPIYVEAMKRLGLPAARVVAIGDMLETDVLGARRASLHAVLVLDSGVHAMELGLAPDNAQLQALFLRAGIRPDAVLARFAEPA